MVKKSFREFSLTKQDLNGIGLDITTENLILEVESEGAVLDQTVQLPEISKKDTPLNLNMNDFKGFCNKANASFSFGNINNVSDTHQIPSKFKNKEKLFADINSLEKIHLNTNYARYTGDGNVRDINKIKKALTLMLPSLKIEIIDQKTKQSYMVEAKSETMVLFRGAKEVGGHYCTASIDDNGNIFIQNDSRNTTIEDEYYNIVADRKQRAEFIQKTTVDKLIEYINLQQLYPTSIGFKIISKTPISS